jgi:hypothetical protein
MVGVLPMAPASAALAGSSAAQSVLKTKSKAIAVGLAAASRSISVAVCVRVQSFSGALWKALRSMSTTTIRSLVSTGTVWVSASK